MRMTELTDEQWQRLQPLLPPPREGRGRPRADDRNTLNGILYVLRTGCRWEDVPREYGSPPTCWRRLRRWEQDGIWEKIWRSLLVVLDDQDKLEWDKAFLDGSFVPAKKGGAGVGKTKSGKGTKVMLVADGYGLPIGFRLASANHHEVKLAPSTLQNVWVPRGGRPKQRPKELVADRAYDSKSFRGWLRSRGIKPTIPHYEPRERKRSKRGRPVAEAGAGYGERWKVERTFAWLSSFRRLLVRHERYLSTFRAFFLVAFILVSLRRL
jgi:transposase